MAINTTFSKTITITEDEQELTPETFAQNGKVAACSFDNITFLGTHANLMIKFNDYDDYVPWTSGEQLRVRAQSVYVKNTSGTTSTSVIATIRGIQMTMV